MGIVRYWLLLDDRIVPTGLARFLHTQKLELEHIALAVADVGSGSMPDVEVDQSYGAGRSTKLDLLFAG